MKKYIHNKSGTVKVYMGTEVLDNSFYLIDPIKDLNFIQDDQLLADIASGDAAMSIDGVIDLNITESMVFLLYKNEAFEQRFRPYPERSNGFTSKNVQEAIEEVRNSNISAIFSLVYGEAGKAKDEWLDAIGDKKNSDDTPHVLPWDADLIRITFSNRDNDADLDLEVWRSLKDDGDNATKVHEWRPRDIRTGVEVLSSPVSFNFGDKVGVYSEDNGRDPDNLVVILWFKVRTDNGATFIETWSGNLDGHGSGNGHGSGDGDD